MSLQPGSTLALLWAVLLAAAIIYTVATYVVEGMIKRRSVVIPLYDPPAGWSPAALGTLYDGRTYIREITATLLDLHARGIITLDRLSESAGLTGSAYRITLNSGATGMTPAEQTLIEGIMQGNTTVTPSAFNEVQQTVMSNAYEAFMLTIMRELAHEGYFLGPWLRKKIFNKYTAIIWILISPVVLLFLPILLICAFLMFVATKNRLSPKGQELWKQAAGFREYLRTAERYRLEFAAQSHAGIAQYAAYATALGVSNEWIAYIDAGQSSADNATLHEVATNITVLPPV